MGVRLKDRSFGVGVLLAILFLANYVNCQYYIEGSRPVYVIPEEELDNISQVPSSEPESDVLTARSGIDFTSSEEVDSSAQVEDSKDGLGRASPIDLPEDFDESVKKNIATVPQGKQVHHGDPGKLDDDDEEGRSAEARLIWPFSIEITKGKGANKGWGSPSSGGHGSVNRRSPPPNFAPYPYRRHSIQRPQMERSGHKKGLKRGIQRQQQGRHGHGKGGYSQEFHFKAGHHNHGKGHGWGGFPGRHGGGHGFGGGHGGGHGWGGDHGHGWGGGVDYEHEKHKLKFEILKLKAKKKIALLQNKVELKKLLSLLLQKKIQALEWCYTEWLSDGQGWGDDKGHGHSHGWGGGDNHGWHPYAGKYHSHGYPKGTFLTDDEVLSSKHYKKYRKKKKKKIKKLKKKLKFKRLVQKILQKHISYLDKVAPY